MRTTDQDTLFSVPKHDYFGNLHLSAQTPTCHDEFFTRRTIASGAGAGAHEHGLTLEDLRRQENLVDLVHRHQNCRVHGTADLRVRPRRPHPDGADVLGEVERVPRSGEGGHRAVGIWSK